MIYFTSDWHLFHKNVIRLCDRPYATLDVMHHDLIHQVLKVLKPRDTLVFVGDTTFGNTTNTKQVLEPLRDAGIRLVCVRGNHDPSEIALYNMGFDLVVNSMDLRIGGQRVLVSHYPFGPSFWRNIWLRMRGIKLRYNDRRPKQGNYFLIHGHTHSKRKLEGRALHVGVDAWGFKPVSIEDIESHIARYLKGDLKGREYGEPDVEVREK